LREERQQAAEKLNQEQQKAKTVFTAKQPARSNRVLVVAGSLVIVTLLCAGAAFYYLQSTGTSQFTPQQVRRPAINPADNPIAKSDAPAPNAGGSATANSNAEVTPPAADKTKTGADSSGIASTVSANPNAVQNPATAPKLVADNQSANPGKDGSHGGALAENPQRANGESPQTDNQREQAAQVAEADKIQVHRGVAPTAVSANLQNAYRQFNSGDLDGARTQYENALRNDPNNRDALLGTAAIALSRNQTTQAASIYSRLLDLDPNDAEAIAGLTSLRRGDPEQSESQLKKALVQHPQSGATLFELGNLYAQQSRWAEAQQSYFQAFTISPTNADFAFNLAVSLDHLGQGKLALEYYRQALASAKGAPSKFKQSAAQDRIDKLQQAVHDTRVE